MWDVEDLSSQKPHKIPVTWPHFKIENVEYDAEEHQALEEGAATRHFHVVHGDAILRFR